MKFYSITLFILLLCSFESRAQDGNTRPVSAIQSKQGVNQPTFSSSEKEKRAAANQANTREKKSDQNKVVRNEADTKTEDLVTAQFKKMKEGFEKTTPGGNGTPIVYQRKKKSTDED